MPELVGVQEASAILEIHRGTFWAWRRAGRLPEPVIKIGTHSLFDREQILAAKEEEPAA
jgi:excisionase family DNA binding protein